MSAFLAELHRWKPAGSPPPSITLEEAEAYCRHLATTHYENFPVVSRMLPRSLRQHFCNVYAYCRWADDLADETGPQAAAAPGEQTPLELLSWWRTELRSCYAGQATHPVFVALGPTIREFEIPIEPFQDLLSAFEQDQTVTRYETFAQLQDYCRRSANPVGRLVLYLVRQARPEHFAWSDSICTGLQLANFWQDVSRDLDIGRVYLPSADMARFGYTLDALRRRETTPEFLALLKFEVDRAETFLTPFHPGERTPLARFPFRTSLAIRMFAAGGRAILGRIRSARYRVLERRPRLRKLNLLAVMAGCLTQTLLRR